MNKTLFFVSFSCLLCLFPTLSAQNAVNPDQNAAVEKPKKWKFDGMVGLNAAQAGFWNWAAGGENSISGNVYLNAGAYYLNGKHSWDSDLSTEYGLIYNNSYEGSTLVNSQKVRSANGLRKNMDKFELSTKYGYNVGKEFYISALADFKTQFSQGFTYGTNGTAPDGTTTKHTETLTSDIFSPAYSNISVGVDYKGVKGLTLYLSPISGKFTIVTNDNLRKNYSINPNKNFKAEIGAYFKAGCNYTLGKNKNINIKSTLDLFTSYLERPFTKVDVNWDVFVGIKVWEYLSVTLSTSLKYDENVQIDGVNSKVQFKEVLGLGVSYNIPSKAK